MIGEGIILMVHVREEGLMRVWDGVGRLLRSLNWPHVLVYVDILHRWQIYYHQRLELLKANGKNMSLKKAAEMYEISKCRAYRCDEGTCPFL